MVNKEVAPKRGLPQTVQRCLNDPGEHLGEFDVIHLWISHHNTAKRKILYGKREQIELSDLEGTVDEFIVVSGLKAGYRCFAGACRFPARFFKGIQCCG